MLPEYTTGLLTPYEHGVFVEDIAHAFACCDAVCSRFSKASGGTTVSKTRGLLAASHTVRVTGPRLHGPVDVLGTAGGRSRRRLRRAQGDDRRLREAMLRVQPWLAVRATAHTSSAHQRV